MQKNFFIDGTILTPGGWVKGQIEVIGSHIASIRGEMLRPGELPQAPFVLPGFIDLHVHGGGGFDCLEGEASTRGMVDFHARNGTVAILPTTSTAPIEMIETALGGIARVMASQKETDAEILGSHLEGPFISEHRLGAQESRPLAGDVTLAARWADICPIRVATVAPEISGGMAVARELARRGVRLQVGHSIADDETLRHAFAIGYTGYTHLFNAMTPVDHKTSGIAAYAMAHGLHAEIIADLRHVHPTVLLAACRAIPKLYAITDAVGVAGLPDGEHTTRGGRRTIIKTGIDVFLKNRPTTRGGSGATMITNFQSLMSLGLSLERVSEMTSTRAADYIGASDLGRIQPGMKASLVRLDAGYNLEQVYIKGHAVLNRAQ